MSDVDVMSEVSVAGGDEGVTEAAIFRGDLKMQLESSNNGKGIKGARGQLYVVLETFDVANEKSTRWSDRGVPTVSVAELLLHIIHR